MRLALRDGCSEGPASVSFPFARLLAVQRGRKWVDANAVKTPLGVRAPHASWLQRT